MQFKVKHKLTFDSPDYFTAQNLRQNRKTKTMIKSYRSVQKDGQFLGPSSPTSTACKDQKQMKTLVQSKIQQLHQKMKTFFSHQRKNHLQQIAPEMQQIANSINQLKQQLNKPKSMEQIEEEKHQLLRRKVALLKQIEQTNKKVKDNKLIFSQLKFETQQLDRQLKNGHATIEKYKQKLQANKSKLQQKQSIHSGGTEQPYQSESNLQRILNESLCQQNCSSSTKGKVSIHQTSQLTTQRQSDHVHITEVICHTNNSFKKQNQANLNPNTNLTYQNQPNSAFSHPNQTIFKSNQQLKNYNSIADTNIKKSQHHMSEILQNQLAKMTRKNTISTNSFEEYLKYSTLLQTNLKKHDQSHRYTKNSLKNTFGMSSELRKYEEITNKQKWKQIGSLFELLKSPPAKNCLFPKKDCSQTAKSQKNKAHINDLEELLMDELRKEQFQSFKEKGYHEGLKDKTHQIKIEIKRIFKNFSPNEFFQSIINKKPIKKQLAIILEDSFN